MFGLGRKTEMVREEAALPGRDMEMPVPQKHFVLGTNMRAPWPDGHEVLIVGMGCFWGAERKFWQADGVYSTQVGYAAALPPTRLMKKYAAARPAIMKWCKWFLIRPKSHAMKSCRFFGRTTIRHKACGKAMMSARNIAPAFIA